MTCPTVNALREVLFSSGPNESGANSIFQSEAEMNDFLKAKGLDIANCDHNELRKMLHELALELTDYQLMQTTGGEKVFAKAIGAITVGGALAVGAGVGAGVTAAKLT